MKRKNFEQIFVFIQANTACRRQMTTTNLLHKYFNTKNIQIGITFRFSCYQQSNQLLFNKKMERIF